MTAMPVVGQNGGEYGVSAIRVILANAGTHVGCPEPIPLRRSLLTERQSSKLLAVIVVVLMVASTAVVTTSLMPSNTVPDQKYSQKVDAEANGAVRSLKYEISRLGESYVKPTNYSMLGRSDHTQPGINQWYVPVRMNNAIIHNSWPYALAWDPNMDQVIVPPTNPLASWIVTTFCQLKVDAENITELATGVQNDPWIVPILHTGADPDADDGGWVNMSLYQNYLKDQEVMDIKAGVHYANTFYGVSKSEYATIWKATQYPNDGWFSEIQGHWDFSRRAAHKFLGLPGTGDLVAEFNAVGAAAIATSWENEWIADGDVHGPLDIYTAYEYSLKTGNGPVTIWLKLDSENSTSDRIALWMWSQTWGAEFLLERYLDKVGVERSLIPMREDWYLNGTLCPSSGDIHERMTTTYHVTAWNDKQAYNNPAWMLEPQHMDILPERLGDAYVSKFDPYAWTYYGSDYKPTRLCLAPGVGLYGQQVRYWQTPMNWNLAADESLTVILPSSTQNGWGIEPYWSNNYSLPGFAVTEMQSNGRTGEFVLGHGYPETLYSATYYNPATKTITIPGGTSFDPNMNPIPGYTTIFESGSPLFYFDISPVSHYNLSIVDPGPYSVGHTYTLRVTPRDLAYNPVSCNQTVCLPGVTGVTFGASSHTFAWGETYWETTVSFDVPGNFALTSEDQYFYLDIVDVYSIKVGFEWMLYQGWNLACNPLVGLTYRASTLGLEIADVVAGFNSSTGVYDKVYIVGASPGWFDFAILPGTGYWIYINKGVENITLYGTMPTGPQTMNVTVPQNGGWAMIGLRSLNTAFKASDLPGMCSGGRILVVAGFDNILKVYKTYIVGGPPSTDFYLVAGHAYWIYCNGNLTMTYDP
jgi:hypothetical protein